MDHFLSIVLTEASKEETLYIEFVREQLTVFFLCVVKRVSHRSLKEETLYIEVVRETAIRTDFVFVLFFCFLGVVKGEMWRERRCVMSSL